MRYYDVPYWDSYVAEDFGVVNRVDITDENKWRDLAANIGGRVDGVWGDSMRKVALNCNDRVEIIQYGMYGDRRLWLVRDDGMYKERFSDGTLYSFLLCGTSEYQDMFDNPDQGYYVEKGNWVDGVWYDSRVLYYIMEEILKEKEVSITMMESYVGANEDNVMRVVSEADSSDCTVLLDDGKIYRVQDGVIWYCMHDRIWADVCKPGVVIEYGKFVDGVWENYHDGVLYGRTTSFSMVIEREERERKELISKERECRACSEKKETLKQYRGMVVEELCESIATREENAEVILRDITVVKRIIEQYDLARFFGTSELREVNTLARDGLVKHLGILEARLEEWENFLRELKKLLAETV